MEDAERVSVPLCHPRLLSLVMSVGKTHPFPTASLVPRSTLRGASSSCGLTLRIAASTAGTRLSDSVIVGKVDTLPR